MAALSLRRSGPFNLLGGGKPPFAYVGVEGHKKPRKEGEEVPPDPTPTMVQAKMAEEFAETVAAMQQLGIDVASAAKTIGGLLHLGNISFEVFQPPGQKVEGCKVTDASSEALETAAGLLGLSTLPFVLTRRSVQAGGGRRSMYDSPLTKKEANYTRDALAKKLYEGLFDYTVRSINNVLGGSHLAALKREPTVEEKSAMPSAGWIGLLDVFGFEIFHRNGFEQLMVNLANERLQRFFLEGIFQREQDEYKMEELPWVPIVDVPDNTDCINTIESKPFGVLPLLDEQCRLGDRGSDGTLCETLNQRNPAAAAAVEALGKRAAASSALMRPLRSATLSSR